MSNPKNAIQKACAEAAEICACFNMRRAARAVTRLYDAGLESSGLRSTQFVMLVIIRANGSIELPELARKVGLERSVLTRRLDPLVRSGFVAKKASRTGGATVASLTAKGTRKLLATVPLWEQVQSGFERHMGERRWRSMLADLSVAQTADEDVSD